MFAPAFLAGYKAPESRGHVQLALYLMSRAWLDAEEGGTLLLNGLPVSPLQCGVTVRGSHLVSILGGVFWQQRTGEKTHVPMT